MQRGSLKPIHSLQSNIEENRWIEFFFNGIVFKESLERFLIKVY